MIIDKVEPFSADEIKVLSKASTDFVYFVNNIFSKSSKHFTGGEHVDNTARMLASNKRTIRVSARNHFKSYSFYAHFMWKLMFDGAQSNIEAHYFSFNSELSGSPNQTNTSSVIFSFINSCNFTPLPC